MLLQFFFHYYFTVYIYIENVKDGIPMSLAVFQIRCALLCHTFFMLVHSNFLFPLLFAVTL